MAEISIIMPAYNVEKYLEKSVESVLCQTFDDFELILVNDGSTDSTGEICERYALNEPRITYISKENGGVASARNAALEIAKGEYLYFMDSDDWIEPTTLEKAFVCVREHDAEVLVFDYYKDRPDGSKRIFTLHTMSAGLYEKPEDVRAIAFRALSINMKEWNPKYIWTKLISKSIMLDNGIRFHENVNYVDDVIASIEIFLNCTSVYYLPEPFYHYVYRSSSYVRSYTKDRSITSQNAYYIVKSMLEKHNADPAFYTMLHSVMVARVVTICESDIFHRKNQIPFRQRIKAFTDYINSECITESYQGFDRQYITSPRITKLYDWGRKPHPFLILLACLLRSSFRSLYGALSRKR